MRPTQRAKARQRHADEHHVKSSGRLSVADDKDIAVFDDVLFALEAEEAFFADAGVAVFFDQGLANTGRERFRSISAPVRS